ncbi:hypothetical protein [Brevibacterium sp. FME37]|uniref:hypothetical protein n=1 Tax=Brevibacterium sp. FME37 TaxID=2742607 RepID=UPI0018671BC8|nr:hypothetical protein [Brevibacterium sp. FME37]
MNSIETVMSVLATAGLWLVVGGMTLLLLMVLLSRTGRTVLRGLGDELEMELNDVININERTQSHD